MKIILKPVHWNPNGYTSPAGHPAKSGYPKEFGFGHEEWNNSPRLQVVRDDRAFRVFFTEASTIHHVNSNSGTLIFMYASHDGRQELVGIAANARHLNWKNKDDSREIAHIRKSINTKLLWRDIWNIPQAKEKFTTEEKLKAYWQDNGLTLNWICPEELFCWLDSPMVLDPVKITGKSKLLSMFSRHTDIEPSVAAAILDSVPLELRNDRWLAIRTWLADGYHVELIGPHAAWDIQRINQDQTLDATTKDVLIKARLGQGKFRDSLLKRSNNRCALTGCDIRGVLRASHIKPWRSSNNTERLDADNGLLLAAHVDALFDLHLISFSKQGALLVSSEIPETQLRTLGLEKRTALTLRPEQEKYMAHHRAVFKKKRIMNGQGKYSFEQSP